ncbi:MAG: TIM-barrel domain-containing protein [Chitinophagaceae bacterium]
MHRYKWIVGLLFVITNNHLYAQNITVAGQPGQLDIRAAGEHSIRVTLKPVSFTETFPYTPALAERGYPVADISVRAINSSIQKKMGALQVEVRPRPLTVIVKDSKGNLVQNIVLHEDGTMSFKMDDQPVLGLGEGGPKPVPGTDWRKQQIQYDRRGAYDSMQPRWQADVYGSRNPVPMLIGTEGWGIFVATPWVQVDLQHKERGVFIPWKPTGREAVPQTVKNQGLNQGKGLPPINQVIPGLYDFFIFDAHDPAVLMREFSVVCGPAVLPPKWALGYMQSHRTLQNEKQVIGIVDTFRAKKIPVDAVIYLGTGFTPRGWNKPQPSFDFNPEIFSRRPETFISDMHNRKVKVVLHMVPWDRDKLPTLHGNIPPKAGERIDSSHLHYYWQQHVPLVTAGTDGFWPDEGDWFNLFERIKRHQLYYQGSLSTRPNTRPWSLHRNGYPGISQWGGWVWSGDTESSWKTLEGQIAVGLNHSLSLSPFWGSDIGGFTPNEELTGELYARWFQFGAFNASFRSHGRTWRTRLPWGWGQNDMSPKESRANPLQSEMNNPAIEPVIKKYDELHYQLMPYTYTLTWQARNTGMPMMRSMWLHYPTDKVASKTGDQFLWGSDLLIAPVFEKGATTRSGYLPAGDWYDWWTNAKSAGGKSVTREVDLATMPIYVRAGAIIPLDPIRQYTGEEVSEPTVLKIYTGTNGTYTLYEDDGISLDYLVGKATWTRIEWNNRSKQLTLSPGAPKEFTNQVNEKIFRVELVPSGITKTVNYRGRPLKIAF